MEQGQAFCLTALLSPDLSPLLSGSPQISG